MNRYFKLLERYVLINATDTNVTVINAITVNATAVTVTTVALIQISISKEKEKGECYSHLDKTVTFSQQSIFTNQILIPISIQRVQFPSYLLMNFR